MKQPINEIRRMQQLAGILVENEQPPKEIRIKFTEGGEEKFRQFYQPTKIYDPDMWNKLTSVGYDMYANKVHSLFIGDDSTWYLKYVPKNKEIFIFPSEAGYRPIMGEEEYNIPKGTGSAYCTFDKLDVGGKDHREYFEIVEVN